MLSSLLRSLLPDRSAARALAAPLLLAALSLGAAGCEDTQAMPDQARPDLAGADLATLPDQGGGTLRALIAAEARWIRTESQLPSGAITVNDPAGRRIVPYLGNQAALGLVKDRDSRAAVQAWLDWYFARYNSKDADRWGMKGTIYDFTVSPTGLETSTGNADATDTCAATLLTLARAYYDTGEAGAQAYVKKHRADLELVASVLVQTLQPDGLTWAKPDFKTKYLSDNSEVFRGLLDLAYLMDMAWGDGGAAATYAAHAASVSKGIDGLWAAASENYSWARAEGGSTAPSSFARWSPDAMANLAPILGTVITPDSERARLVYTGFTAAQPGWTRLQKSDEAPWASVALVAVLRGDVGSAQVYVDSVRTTYVNGGRPWPWASHEAGWLIRVLAALDEQPGPTGGM